MKKSKPAKKIKRRVRRNPFARALETAENRLIKASAEFTKCQARITALSMEIPKLADTIRSLNQQLGKDTGSPSQELSTTARPDKPILPLPPAVQALVPEHLRRFIQPHISTLKNSEARGGAVAAASEFTDEDAFLKDTPEGIELLP